MEIVLWIIASILYISLGAKLSAIMFFKPNEYTVDPEDPEDLGFFVFFVIVWPIWIPCLLIFRFIIYLLKFFTITISKIVKYLGIYKKCNNGKGDNYDFY